MAFGHGKNAAAYLAGWKLSDYITNLDLSMSADTDETTVMNSSGAKSYIGGQVDATVSADGLHDGAAGSIDSTLRTILASSAQQVWSVWPQGPSTGKTGWGTRTLATKYEVKTPVTGVVSLSIAGQANIGCESMVSLKNLAAVSATTNSASYDGTAASTKGGVGYLQRTSTDTKTATVLVQHSSAATSWATLVTFTATTGRSGQRVAVSGNVKRYLRSSWTISTGGSGSPVFNVGFYRK